MTTSILEGTDAKKKEDLLSFLERCVGVHDKKTRKFNAERSVELFEEHLRKGKRLESAASYATEAFGLHREKAVTALMNAHEGIAPIRRMSQPSGSTTAAPTPPPSKPAPANKPVTKELPSSGKAGEPSRVPSSLDDKKPKKGFFALFDNLTAKPTE